MKLRAVAAASVGALALAFASGAPALGAKGRSTGSGTQTTTTATGSNAFSTGQLQSQTVGAPGCGTNAAGEPAIHVSKANLVALGSENGIGGGSEFWSGTQVGGTTAATACQLTYDGQPNGAGGVGASGGDIDVAIAPTVDPATGTYRIYVSSLNLASVNVATSTDNGKTFTQVPVVEGVPVDDREWIAAYGPATALLTYHDVSTDNIDVLRSDDGGQTFTQTSTAINPTDPNATNNELGNIVIDHNNTAGAAPGQFWAYQSYVAPSDANSSTYNEAFLAVSNDGGSTWTDKPIPCSTAFGSNGLDHNFPNVSVAPNGTIFYSVSNDKAVYVMMSTDHGDTWTCSGPVSSTSQAIFPWIVATSAGEDLVYYGASGSGSSQIWSVYFAQNLTQAVTGWSTTKVVDVHQGAVCEGGINCTSGRQLFDDFGVDTDQSGWAHIAYSHDSPNLGGSGTYTGYAVQTGGTAVGVPN